MRILGVDPGSRATGYGVVELDASRVRLVAGGVIRVRGSSLSARLGEIHVALEQVILRTLPQEAAVEAVFSARNPRSALLLGQARGAVLSCCGRSHLEAAEYSPAQVKQAVAGYGAAGKAQVQQMVKRILGHPDLFPTDQADALAVAICHAHMLGRAAATIPAPRPASRLQRAVEGAGE